MKNKIFFILIFLLTCQFTMAQQTFRETIGGTLSDDAMAIVKTYDSGYVVVGDTYSFGNGKSDMYIVKLDAKGNIIWNKTFGGADYDHAAGVIETADSGFAVIGTSGSNSSYMCMVKIDKEGGFEWSKYFSASKRCGGHSIVQALDGGYVLGGYAETYNDGSWGYLLKTDGKGNLLWSKKVFDLDSYPSVDYVVNTKDSGYAMVAKFPSPSYYDIFLIKVNGVGDFKWAKSIGGASSDLPAALQRTSDDGFIIAGSSISFGSGWRMYAIKTDSLGNLKWAKTIGTGSGTNFKSQFAKSVVETKDKGFIIAGTTDSSTNNVTSPYIVKFDSSGNVVWTKVIYTDKAVAGFSSTKFIRSSDGGYAAAGSISTTSSGNDYYFMKFDSTANICGTNAPIGIDEAHGEMVNQSVNITNAVSSTFFGVSDVLKPAAGVVNTICSAILPAKLLSFTIAQNGGINMLSWSTSEEINTSYFELQKSSNGFSFTPLGKVNASGNSSTVQNYQFNDVKPFPGTNYYRLKTIDKDGYSSLSQVISLYNNNTKINVYPNPVKDKLTIEINSSLASFANVQLINMEGKTLYRGSMQILAGLTIQHLTTDRLPKGVYLLNMTIGVEHKQIKFVKE